MRFLYHSPIALLLGASLFGWGAVAQTLPTARAAVPAASSVSLRGQILSSPGLGPRMAQGGAAITVFHLPTGTRYTAVTDKSGRFTVTGLAEGGPYLVQVQQPGFQVQRITDLYLQAGQSTVLAVTLGLARVETGTRRANYTAFKSTGPFAAEPIAARGQNTAVYRPGPSALMNGADVVSGPLIGGRWLRQSLRLATPG